MATTKNHREQTKRRLDVIKVHIEDVNLNGQAGPVAQGRDHLQWGLFDIDLTQSVGESFPLPVVGEVWWIKRGGRAWVLDRKIDPSRVSPENGGNDKRSGVPTNVYIGFNVREKKTSLEYEAYATFDAVTTDENGDPANPEHYVINWVPCTKDGNVIAYEKVRQHLWDPNDPTIDPIDDLSADYYAVLPGNVPRPKVWYWKGRVRAVSEGGHKGPWSNWTDPVLPVRVALPEPPVPGNIALTFKWKDTEHQPVFSAITRFDDVNYWDIPGYDYEDDISEYVVQLMPLQRNDTTGTIDLTSPLAGYTDDGHKYDRADPNGDGEPWEIRRKKVNDKDKSDTFVTLGTLAEDITGSQTIFSVDETGSVGIPAAPFIVLTDTSEQWLVYNRTNISGNLYSYEVYRQFKNSPFSLHSTAAPLTWLKDPFHYKVDFSRVERPKTVYWMTRVRSKDRFNRSGPWSNWTAPLLPWKSIDFTVPVPLDLRADIEIHEYKTHPEYKLVARFKDPAPNGWNIPGGDLQDDLDHYVVIAQPLVQDPQGYVIDSSGVAYRLPDRKIGIVKTQVNPADASVVITLDTGLPNSILRMLQDSDKQKVYLRIETPSVFGDIEGEEVLATEGLTLSSGQDRTYTVVRGQYGTGDHGHNVGDFVYLLTENERREIVQDKDKDEPGKFTNRYVVNMGRIPQASQHYWRVKAKSVDTFGHKSLWSPWSNPINPANDPDLIIDAPNYVSLRFDRVHRDKTVRFRTVVEWAEVDYTAPDGNHEPDVSRYAIQLASSDGDYLDLDLDSSSASVLINEIQPINPVLPFFTLIGDEIIQVTDRVLIGGGENTTTLYQYTIVRAQRGTVASLHPQGQLLYSLPFEHKTASAKPDSDPNNYNTIVFPRALKYRYYKSRVRAIDRYNRTSNWSAWTSDGTPSDNTAPHIPINLVIDVDNHKVHAAWDIPIDPRDGDSDANGAIPGTDVDYFQVQLANANNFSNSSILKFDRFVRAMTKTMRVTKPGIGTFYVRVRSVDSSGNKSAWLSGSASMNGTPTPNPPTVAWERNEDLTKLRGVVSWTEVSFLDADITGYDAELQQADKVFVTEDINLNKVNISVQNTNGMPNTPFTAWIDWEEITVTSIVDNQHIVIRRGSPPLTHSNGARLQFFSNNVPARHQRTGSNPDLVAVAIFTVVRNLTYYRARVRAEDSQGRYGDWSAWAPPSRSYDPTTPPPPTNVDMRVNQHFIHIKWDTTVNIEDVMASGLEPLEFIMSHAPQVTNVPASIKSQDPIGGELE